ncbi:MAG: VOC family protein [Spirochaetaceae bacterium]|jgi:hypothetical protein|nr:VOC family protein [Spirochaetaceae bacterium]
MKNAVDLKGFIQVALVVQDIEKAAKAWAELFNVPAPEIRIDKPARNPDLTYRGREAFYGLKFAVIEVKERGFVIELHEAGEGESTFKEFLDKHGNGVHHLGFCVGERRDAVIGELEEMGFQMRTVGYYPGSSWTIVDSEDTLGVNLNIKPKP